MKVGRTKASDASIAVVVVPTQPFACANCGKPIEGHAVVRRDAVECVPCGEMDLDAIFVPKGFEHKGFCGRCLHQKCNHLKVVEY